MGYLVRLEVAGRKSKPAKGTDSGVGTVKGDGVGGRKSTQREGMVDGEVCYVRITQVPFV